VNDELQYIYQAPEQQPPRRTDPLAYKSNTYSVLLPHEQGAIYTALLVFCHSSAQLRAENYTMPDCNKCRTNTNVNYSEFHNTPTSSPGERKRKAIAIDCEMVGLTSGRECVALVSAVDVLTGEILLNAYVNPTARVRSWRTQFSGVTRAIMDSAIKQGQALGGWKAARRALWEYIDADTILVGHALHHDLNVLGMFHSRVVDTAILSAQAVFPEMRDRHFPRQWGLKKLCGYFLDILIQTGKKGHDCLEDTLATRELVLSCLVYPERLMAWGQQARLEYDLKLLARNPSTQEGIKKNSVKNVPPH
jgi:DNA polymerase III epsilon subunit-like protein